MEPAPQTMEDLSDLPQTAPGLQMGLQMRSNIPSKKTSIRSLAIGTHIPFFSKDLSIHHQRRSRGGEFHDQRRAGLPFGRKMSTSLRLLFQKKSWLPWI